MHAITRSIPLRIRRRRALATGLLVCLALTGCKEVDPLEAIRQQQAAGDIKGSVEPLRKLLETRPDDPETNYLYGIALAQTEPNLAVFSLRKAMDDPAWLVPAGSQLAFLSLAGYDFPEVYKIAERILEQDPENVQVLLIRANAYAHSKQHPELALAEAKRVLEIDRDAIEAYEPMILALLDLGRLDEANQALAEAGRRLVELERGDDVRAWHCATTAAFDQESGDLEKTRKTWIACLDAHPTDADVVSNAVVFYDAQGEPKRSIEILRAALAGAPDTRRFRTMLAQHLRGTGDAAGAEEVLREATLSENPEIAVAGWLDLAKFQQGLERYDDAADSLERAVEFIGEVGSPNAQILFEYADALVLANRLDRALEVAEDLPVPAHRHLILGRVAQERRRPAEALEAFDEALKLWPDNPWARYYAALAAEELGDFARALEEFRNSVRIQPDATDARTRGAALQMASGNPSAALVMLETEVTGSPLEIEGKLLGMRVSGLLGNTTGVSEFLVLIEASNPGWVGKALAEAAEGLARSGGPAMALSMLTTAPGVDFSQPRYALALRAIIRFSHEAAQTSATRSTYEKILAAHPDSGAFQEIRALDLELSGAPTQTVRAAYARAVELAPGYAPALTSLGRLTVAEDPAAALTYFDRAAAADPSNPEPKLAAARALIASGKPAEATQRLDALLLDHPFEAEAAAEIVRLDLAQEIATPQTLERARRAVRFGGGADALELLSRVHAQRDETELAARAAEEAKSLRSAKASEG